MVCLLRAVFVGRSDLHCPAKSRAKGKWSFTEGWGVCLGLGGALRSGVPTVPVPPPLSAHVVFDVVSVHLLCIVAQCDGGCSL